MADDIVLYTFWRSSCAHRVRLALAHKKLNYTSVFINLIKGEQLDSRYRQKNPSGYVPAIEIDGHLLTESVAILEYLEETHPQFPLLPKSPYERALVRAAVQMIACGIQPLQNLNVLTKISEDPSAPLAPGTLYNERGKAFARHFNERGLSAFEDNLAAFEKQGVRGPFCFGEQFTMADVLLIPQLAGARRFGVDLTPFKRILRVEQASASLECVIAAAPENQPDFTG
jgi:maleylpyruvate isomerase